MNRVKQACLAALLCAPLILAGEARAWGGHGGGYGGGGGHYYGGGGYGGHYYGHGGGYGGGWYGGVIIGPGFGWGAPYYPAPYYAYPPAVVTVPASPPVYIEQGGGQPAPQSQSNYWYYCADAQAYYPYVKECPGGWQQVSPQPPPPQ